MIYPFFATSIFCIAVALFFLFDGQMSFWFCLAGAAATVGLLCSAIGKHIRGVIERGRAA